MRWRRTIKASFATCTAPCLTGTKRKQAAQPEDDEAAGGWLPGLPNPSLFAFPSILPRWALLKVSKQHWPAIKSPSAIHWAAMNTAFMKKFRVPAQGKNLIIFADADSNAAGHAAAFECAAPPTCMRKNDLGTVSVRWPAQGDFNDLLLNGSEVFEMEYSTGGMKR